MRKGFPFNVHPVPPRASASQNLTLNFFFNGFLIIAAGCLLDRCRYNHSQKYKGACGKWDANFSTTQNITVPLWSSNLSAGLAVRFFQTPVLIMGLCYFLLPCFSWLLLNYSCLMLFEFGSFRIMDLWTSIGHSTKGSVSNSLDSTPVWLYYPVL